MLGNDKTIKAEALTTESDYLIDINKISPNPKQPRKKFDNEKLIELSESIKNSGLLVPILVQETQKKGFFHIVAGVVVLRNVYINLSPYDY